MFCVPHQGLKILGTALVGRLVEVVGVVAVEGVAGHGEVGGDGDAQQRVPEPDDVHVREDEAVAELQDAGLEPVPAPQHVVVVPAMYDCSASKLTPSPPTGSA